MTKTKLGGKLPVCNLPWVEVRVGMQGRWMEAGIKAEAVEKCSLLVCLSWLTQLLSCTPQDQLSRQGTTHGGLDPFTPVINRENVLQACLQASPRG